MADPVNLLMYGNLTAFKVEQNGEFNQRQICDNIMRLVKVICDLTVNDDCIFLSQINHKLYAVNFPTDYFWNNTLPTIFHNADHTKEDTPCGMITVRFYGSQFPQLTHNIRHILSGCWKND